MSTISMPWESVAADSAAHTPRWLTQDKAGREPLTQWLWDGYLARGEVTLFTSQWKVGKTTLLSLLLDRLGAGGTLAGLDVPLGRAVVVSEESMTHWARRSQRLNFGTHVCFLCRPFPAKPTLPQWSQFIDHLGGLREEHALDLIVLDPLSLLLPSGTENSADMLLDRLRELERLTAAGACVLLLHHPRKGSVLAGQAARGSGAMGAYADVIVEMHCHSKSSLDDRRRRLAAWSRHDETPRQRVIELSSDGLTYTHLPNANDEEFELGWQMIQEILSSDDERLTREQIRQAWEGHGRPSSATLWRWLDRAVEQRLLLVEGTGRRGNPFRYGLPEGNMDATSPLLIP